MFKAILLAEPGHLIHLFPTPILSENLWGIVEWVFHGQDVLPATKLLVWKQHKALTNTSGLAISFLRLPPDGWKGVAPFVCTRCLTSKE